MIILVISRKHLLLLKVKWRSGNLKLSFYVLEFSSCVLEFSYIILLLYFLYYISYITNDTTAKHHIPSKKQECFQMPCFSVWSNIANYGVTHCY